MPDAAFPVEVVNSVPVVVAAGEIDVTNVDGQNTSQPRRPADGVAWSAIAAALRLRA